MEKMVKDFKYEVEIFSDGLGVGDNVFNIMSEKVGYRFGFLINVFENWEVFNCFDIFIFCVFDF